MGPELSLARAGNRGQTVRVGGNAGWSERERSDDDAGFAVMYRVYAPRVHRFCVVLLRDDDLAADAMHDAFVEAVQMREAGELPDQGPRGGVRCTARYAIRHAAWHVLDHTWELEDRASGVWKRQS